MMRATTPDQVHELMRITTDPEHIPAATVVERHLIEPRAGACHYVYEFVLQEGGSFYVEAGQTVWVYE